METGQELSEAKVREVSILRQYQRYAIDAINDSLSQEGINRVAVEMATGLGKTITFAAYIDEWLMEDLTLDYRGRVLVLVHTDELVNQAVDKIKIITKDRWSIGVVKAERDEVNRTITVASVQTLANVERRNRIHGVGLIIVDEAHHAVAKTYVDILEHFDGLTPQDCPQHGEFCACIPPSPVPVIGFSATMSRTDGRGLGTVFQNMAFTRSLPWAIRKGWLIDLVPYTITIPGLEAGTSDAVLDTLLVESIAPEAVVQAWKDHAMNRLLGNLVEYPSTVLFAPLVKSAQAFADAFQEAGVKAEVVHGAMSRTERRLVLDRYETGITTVLCNAMVLTEGWDSPRTMCVIVARPTRSTPLFIQMAGRGLRPWLASEAPPRADQRCILLCVQGTTKDLITVADLSDRIGEVKDGQSFLEMEDQWDIGQDIEPDEGYVYRGPVRVEQWDAMVQASSKAWKYTNGGTPYLPTRKRAEGYVFCVQDISTWTVWTRERGTRNDPRSLVTKLATAPDLELAMAIAEDEAQERGGDIGALLADKNRPWRKGKPSEAAINEARRLIFDQREIEKILSSKASGKAGKLSDLIDRVVASRVLDPNVQKIKERATR